MLCTQFCPSLILSLCALSALSRSMPTYHNLKMLLLKIGYISKQQCNELSWFFNMFWCCCWHCDKLHILHVWLWIAAYFFVYWHLHSFQLFIDLLQIFAKRISIIELLNFRDDTIHLMNHWCWLLTLPLCFSSLFVVLHLINKLTTWNKHSSNLKQNMVKDFSKI